MPPEKRTGTARQHSGHHGSADTGSRRRIHPAAAGGHRGSVKAGQLLAEIDAPELDSRFSKPRATLQQSQAALDQALANYEQGKTNLELPASRPSAGAARQRGVVSRQENDQYQAQYQAQIASVHALEKAIAAQRSNVAAAEANVARLKELQGYRVVKAPFDGVITLRNVDSGALVTAGRRCCFASRRRTRCALMSTCRRPTPVRSVPGRPRS